MKNFLLDIFGDYDTNDFLIISLSTENNFEYSFRADKRLQKIDGFIKWKIKKCWKICLLYKQLQKLF